MPSVKTAQTLLNLKTAQTAFKTLTASYKTAMDDPGMGGMGMGNQKDQLIEKILDQAEILVDTAITAVETVDGGNGAMGNEMSAEPAVPEMGSGQEPPVAEPATDIPGITSEPGRESMGDHGPDEMRTAMDDMEHKIDEQGKELDAMKQRDAQMRLAQKYSELFPVAMRTAKYTEFMGHKAPTSVLEARLDEATVFMSSSNAMKIAQEEDSVFNFEDLGSESTTPRNADTGGKI